MITISLIILIGFVILQAGRSYIKRAFSRTAFTAAQAESDEDDIDIGVPLCMAGIAMMVVGLVMLLVKLWNAGL